MCILYIICTIIKNYHFLNKIKLILATVEVWYAAVTQSFFSLSTGMAWFGTFSMVSMVWYGLMWVDLYTVAWFGILWLGVEYRI